MHFQARQAVHRCAVFHCVDEEVGDLVEPALVLSDPEENPAEDAKRVGNAGCGAELERSVIGGFGLVDVPREQ